MKTYVIESRRERGFWSNKLGWVYDRASASHFTLPTHPALLAVLAPDATPVPTTSARKTWDDQG